MDSIVSYGTTNAYGSTISDPTMITSHNIALTGLSERTIYHFRVTSANVDNIAAQTEDRTFSTRTPLFTATSLGDYGNVAVMEVTGNYDGRNPDGTINDLPRQELAKELLRSHEDNYDFLVILSNFDFVMPATEAKAFYLEVKNDTQGLGMPLFDNSVMFGSNGKLQGTIDMGNIANLGVNPFDQSKFEETLDLLAHEQLHRWGALVKFKNPDGTLNTGLLGKDGTHWSYLLDSDGSILYGNDWKANGDGTFTSVSASKYYSALDLYLMGMIDKTQVPPMTLIQNASIDATKLPEPGAIITGTTKIVTIDDIIAAEGERMPNASTSQKTFKTGFIFITQPGTFTGNEPANIENLRSAWAGRFASLTGGKGSVADVTPSLTVAITSPSDGAAINRPDIKVLGIVANTTGNETGVTVNGIVATVYGNRFTAEHVPLTEGANTITVTATDTAGSTVSSSITVNAATTGNYIRVTSNIESGIAPLEVSLRVDGSFSIMSTSISVTGPAQPEITTIAPDEYNVKMNAEGAYTFTISSIGPDGNTYQDAVTIIVQNRTQLDKLLKATWERMKTALSGGDIEGAVSYFTEGSKESFRQSFTSLIPYLPQIVSGMGEFNLVKVTEHFAECDMRSARDGVSYSLQVLFIQDSSGKWGIRSF